MVDGVKPDLRPVNSNVYDACAWNKASQQIHTPSVRAAVEPQQLGVGVGGGVKIKVWGLNFSYENFKAMGLSRVLVALGNINAHNAFSLPSSIDALNSFSDPYKTTRAVAELKRSSTIRMETNAESSIIYNPAPTCADLIRAHNHTSARI